MIRLFFVIAMSQFLLFSSTSFGEEAAAPEKQDVQQAEQPAKQPESSPVVASQIFSEEYLNQINTAQQLADKEADEARVRHEKVIQRNMRR